MPEASRAGLGPGRRRQRRCARAGPPCRAWARAQDTDTWDSYFGSRYTHGTVFRRAVEEGLIDAHRSAQIGLRGSLYGAADLEDNRALGFATLLARDFEGAGVAGALDLARRRLRSPVYVTVDIDVLDPAFAPGTGTPEAGGLTSRRELLVLLQGLAEPVWCWPGPTSSRSPRLTTHQV